MLGVIEAGIDAFCCGDRGMPKELLDVLHRDSGMPEHRRAGMTQVMETDHSQFVLLEELFECPCHPVDFVPFPILPNEDIVVVFVVVHPSEGLLPLLLLCLHVEQHVLDDAHGVERRCPERFLRLGGVVCYFFPFPVHDGFADRVLDGELLVLKVDGIPFQADDFLSIRNRTPSSPGTSALFLSPSSEETCSFS